MGGRGAAGPGDVILAGARIFGARWQEMLKIGAMTVLPLSLVGVVATTPFIPEVVGDIIAGETTPTEIEHRLGEVSVDQWVQLGVAYGIYLIASWIVTAIALGASIVVARQHVRGISVSATAAIKEALRRIGSLLALSLYAGILSVIGFLFCLLPGVWLVTSWIAAPAVMFHEDRGALASMGSSYRLVRSRFWPTLVVVLLSFVAYFVVNSGTNAVVSVLLAPLGQADGVLFFTAMMVAGGLLAFIGIGLHAGITTEVYLDLVARRDGFQPVPPTPPPLEAFR